MILSKWAYTFSKNTHNSNNYFPLVQNSRFQHFVSSLTHEELFSAKTMVDLIETNIKDFLVLN